MGLFGTQSPMELEIEKATSETNTSEKWSIIMDICDKIGSSSTNAKDSLKIIIKRLNHPDPHVAMQAITLLDACVNNCGKSYHLEIASREFETEFRKLVSKSQPQIATKLKLSLKKWAEGDFKSDPQLNLIPSLYNKMKQDGYDFSEPQTPVKREVQYSKDPNVVASQQEADDIAKAIELSLKEKTTSPKAQSYSTTTAKSNAASSLYPSMNALSISSSSGTPSASASSAAPAQEPRKVRALYDFEAAEDNELTFKAGEIIMVFEESDANWWRGSNHRGEGYFPANFVTADLSMEPEDLTSKESKSSKKNVQFSGEQNSSQEVQKAAEQTTAVEINEETIDRLLFLLHEADPADPSQDSDEMLRLENVVNQMGPLIDSELERVDRKHAQLTQLSSDLIDTINLYHSLMQSDNAAAGMSGMYGAGFGGTSGMYRQPAGAMFNNNFGNMQSLPPAAAMNMMPMPHQQMPGFPPMNNNNNFQHPVPSGNFPMYQQPSSQMTHGMGMMQQMPIPPSSQMINHGMGMQQQPQQQQQPPVNNGIPHHPSQQHQNNNSTLQQQQPPPPQQQQIPNPNHALTHEHQQAMYMNQPGMFPPQQLQGMPQQQQQQPSQSINSPTAINMNMGQFQHQQQQPFPQHLQQIPTMPGGNMAN